MSDPSLRWDIENERVICELCVEWTSFMDLYVDPEGQKWDYCKDCAEKDGYAHMFLWMSEKRSWHE